MRKLVIQENSDAVFRIGFLQGVSANLYSSSTDRASFITSSVSIFSKKSLTLAAGKEELHNETAQEYLEVLERQSSRLKKLIEDLIEASKASTGNLPVHLERLEAGIFMTQTVGEFEEKTKEAGLDLVIEKPETPVYIMADSRHFWRVIDNLMNNICKYAQSGTRVYINLEVKEAQVSITFRNTSKYPLNISSDELMERFVRGDASRNTEGSGLGLSIANSLMDLMGGTFRLYVDGDLFKVVLGFAETAEKETKEKIEEL